MSEPLLSLRQPLLKFDLDIIFFFEVIGIED